MMQASLAAVGFLSGTVAWLMGANTSWAAGGVSLGSAIPFTLIPVAPTNKRLLDPNLDNDSARARKLLVRWGRLHALRTALGDIAFVIFLISMRS